MFKKNLFAIAILSLIFVPSTFAKLISVSESDPFISEQRSTLTAANVTMVHPAGHFQNIVNVKDINGDGIDDLVFSKPGIVYILPGSQKKFYETSELSLNDMRYKFIADEERAIDGVFAVGDVNGDGFNDVLVKSHFAPFAEKPTMAAEDNFNLILGGTDLNGEETGRFFLNENDSISNLLANTDYVFHKEVNGDDMFVEVNNADFNGDGINDISISSAQATRVILGSSEFQLNSPYAEAKSIDLNAEKSFAAILNHADMGHLNDVAIVKNEGSSEIYFSFHQESMDKSPGSNKVFRLAADKILNMDSAVELADAADLILEENNENISSLSMQFGDLDGDNVMDMIVSSTTVKPDPSHVFVFFGANLMQERKEALNLSKANFTFFNDLTLNDTTAKVLVGRFASEKSDDILIGTLGENSEGQSFLFKGSNVKKYLRVVSDTLIPLGFADFIFNGEAANDFAMPIVSGNFNGNEGGLELLIFGTHRYSTVDIPNSRILSKDENYYFVLTTSETGAGSSNGTGTGSSNNPDSVVAPSMTSPVPGSTISTATVNFTWTAGTATDFKIAVGTDINNVNGVSSWGDIYTPVAGPIGIGNVTTFTVNNIPLLGANIIVRLWYFDAGAWSSIDYTYSTSYTGPDLTNPAPGSLISVSPVTFSWTHGDPLINDYKIAVGTTQSNIDGTISWGDIYAPVAGPNGLGNVTQSPPVSGILINGNNVYARLWFKLNNVWYYKDYAFVTGQAADITTPTPGSNITTTSVNFAWTGATPSTATYELSVGTTGVGSSDVSVGALSFGAGVTSTTINNMPLTGGTIYVRLTTLIGTTTIDKDYTYTTGTAGTIAQITTPTPFTTLSAPTSFTWSPAIGNINGYQLLVGTSPGDGSIFNANYNTSTLTSAVVTFPLDGQTLYIRLRSNISGVWYDWDCYYLRATAAKGVINSPATGIPFSSSTQTFGWSAGVGIQNFQLMITSGINGTGTVYYNSGVLPSTTLTVNATGIPLNGNPVYARLTSTFIGGSPSQTDDKTYQTNAATAAVMITPTSGSVVGNCAGSVTFTWSAGVGVSANYLSIGNTNNAANFNIMNNALQTGTTATITIPMNAGPLHVRLTSIIGVSSVNNGYTYTTFNPAPALNAPAPGSTISSDIQTFGWTQGCADDFKIAIGTDPNNINGLSSWGNIYTPVAGNTGIGNILSFANPGTNPIPLFGTTISVRLWYHPAGASATTWNSIDYSYLTANTLNAPVIFNPAGHIVGFAGSFDFKWTQGTATDYKLAVGSSQSNIDGTASWGDILTPPSGSTGLGAGTFNQNSPLPMNLSNFYVRLYFTFDNVQWYYKDYHYWRKPFIKCKKCDEPVPYPEPVYD